MVSIARKIFMRKYFAAVLLVCPLCFFAEDSVSKDWIPKAEEEALFLNRIADFWQEGEYQIAKSQMKEFLIAFPESSFRDLLCAALGDLFLREKSYAMALEYYAKITEEEILSRVFLNRMQCLYYMEWYAVLAEECESFLEKQIDSEERQQAVYYLAIALYQQCLNAEKDPDFLYKLAVRAKPYFESLFTTSLHGDVAAAFGHLCCILKDFPRASSIYLDLAKKETGKEEDMLFQAALIQAEYDKELAMKTFDEIAQKNENRKQEAIYNRLILSFDLKKYEEIILAREEVLQSLSGEALSMAHLFFGRSFHAMKKYPEAIVDLQFYIENFTEISETVRAVFVSLLDASFQSEDLHALQNTIAKMAGMYPGDEELLKGRLSRALLLKKLERIDAARGELESLSLEASGFAVLSDILLERMHLEYQVQNWDLSRDNADRFLLKFPEHEQSSYVWECFIAASSERALRGEREKQQLVEDLERATSLSEGKLNWQFLLARTYFDLRLYEKSVFVLQDLMKKERTPESCFLLALCYRDGFQDLDRFIFLAEEALSLGTPDFGKIHIALYNGYLEKPDMQAAQKHLFGAFQAKAFIPIENLLWLASQYSDSQLREITFETNYLTYPEKAILLFEHVLQVDPELVEHAPLQFEDVCLRLASLYSFLHKEEKSIVLLERLNVQYDTFPDINWAQSPEAKLLLGENYATLGMELEAVHLFDSIIEEKTALRTPTGASASLQSARLHAKISPQQSLVPVLSQLKDLVLQKTLVNEPIHLEAALEYIDLQAESQIEKKISLLKKTKEDFESTRDLLSKDYHQARTVFPEKDKIYQSYIQFFEAEIFLLQSFLHEEMDIQKQLQTKAKNLLLRILEEQAHPSLTARAEKCLNQ